MRHVIEYGPDGQPIGAPDARMDEIRSIMDRVADQQAREQIHAARETAAQARQDEADAAILAKYDEIRAAGKDPRSHLDYGTHVRARDLDIARRNRETSDRIDADRDRELSGKGRSAVGQYTEALAQWAADGGVMSGRVAPQPEDFSDE